VSTSFRWGILATARINDSVVPALQASRGNAVVALASRSHHKADEAATRLNVPRAHGSYDALLADPDVDVVYLPLPNDLHADWAVRCLDAGKHVLIEKPIALTTDEVDTIIAAARRNGRLVMEGFMYRHTPRWQRLIEIVRSGAIGEPRVIRLGFAYRFPASWESTVRFADVPGAGVMWDMGCYAVNMARGVLGVEPQEAAAIKGSRPGIAVDTSVTGLLSFPGATATFSVGFDYVNPPAQVEVIGTEGWVALAGTVLNRTVPSKLLIHSGPGHAYEAAEGPQVEEFETVNPYQLEVEHFADAIRESSPLRWGLDDARANTAVLEAVFASMREQRPVRVAGQPVVG
jgi:xylose dehydrogenase (NAD/NADP)